MTSAIAQERELTLRIRALNKAVTGDEPAPNIITILETIKKEAAPSEDIIRVGRCLIAFS
jgi:transcription elongation factor S-II